MKRVLFAALTLVFGAPAFASGPAFQCDYYIDSKLGGHGYLYADFEQLQYDENRGGYIENGCRNIAYYPCLMSEAGIVPVGTIIPTKDRTLHIRWDENRVGIGKRVFDTVCRPLARNN